MVTFVEANVKTYRSGAAIGADLRVKLSGGKLALAGATDYELGVTREAVFAADVLQGVRLRTAYGTCRMIASEAISKGADVYAAANGKVGATGVVYLGTAETASTVDGDVIEVLRAAKSTSNNLLLTVEAHTADDTLLAAESGTLHTNTGASGTVVLTLPAATVGQQFQFAVGAAQALRLDPNGTETISLPSTGVPGAAGKYLGCSTVGCTVRLVCAVAGNWNVMGHTGTWTAEA